MTATISTTPPVRTFLGDTFELTNVESVKPFYENLVERSIDTLEEFRKFLKDRSELESYLSENFAWRYIKMTCDTTDKEVKAHFDQFVTEIQPELANYDDTLNKKTLESPFLDILTSEGEDAEAFNITFRGIKKATEIFRTENISLFTEVQNLSSEYQGTVGVMTVEIDGQTKTLQQAGVYLENADRAIREMAYRKIQERRIQDRDKLDEVFNKLKTVRHQIALNAGFENFRDYSFASLKRFDYTPKECFDFHEAVAETVVPILNQLAEERKATLALDSLRPWDKGVDVKGRPALHPFNGGEDLLNKTIDCFNLLDPFLGECLTLMKQMGRLDLESRIGKAPGGYNYPLEETGFPFIFMNASSLMRDVITLLHEGGHAVHSIVTKDLALNTFRNFPSEVAELASMSMELITMDYWHVYFDNEEELRRAKIQHLEDILSTLPWVATVDKFQHWIYENPTHTTEERTQAWLRIYEQFTDSITDWSGLETFKSSMWHRQLHIFELPFYYIEYGIAQLGAIGVWKNYKENPQKGLEGYLNALKLGYTKPMASVYNAANIPFDFSKEHIASLMTFLQGELNTLKS
ncbi:M3 family oligoendopeptidase [Flectobacillus sp. BAB-3569]|uniref:M3 family oligoendopeptidase n=1 Tax=Flectobacillus sp. BAB-3569 TaxID=1509483 RepID=UPI000BA3EC93|nr:M3 family oligoendopeptidase [Flectobacillus sp. BAB-3569]PAC27448.1 oligoendopeptidase F [Flectobacillus sp. BAB-3569]